MDNKNRKFWTSFNIIVVSAFFAICLYVYIGFFYPDLTVFATVWSAYKLRIAILLFFPAAVIGLFTLYKAAYLRQIKVRSAVMVLLACIFILLLIFPAGQLQYNRTQQKRIDDFHTFLQLKPNEIGTVDTTAYNIFCLGGSTTEFRDEKGRTWQSLVEEKLVRNYGIENVRLLNSGKQWYSTLHMLINYTQNVRPYRPDAIIVMENINDLLMNADNSRMSIGKFRGDYGHFLGPFTGLIRYNNFLTLLQETLSGLWYQNKPVEIETKKFPGLPSFERNLKTIITLAKHDGTKIILMTQPNIYRINMTGKDRDKLVMLNVETVGSGKKWSYGTAYAGLNAYNDMIRKVAADEQVKLIDLDKAVPKSTAYFLDDVHYKPAAMDIISERISGELGKTLPGVSKKIVTATEQ